MYICKDYSYIKGTETSLIDAGYGELTVHSIHFDRYFSEKQKEKNSKLAESMTRDEWSVHCDEISKSLDKNMKEIINILAGKYSVYQASEITGKNVSYDSDWDLFFWSNRGWNGKDYMDCFSLTFNKNRTPEKNLELLQEIVPLVESMQYENINMRIQYDAEINQTMIKETANKICENLVGKFIEYQGMTGKIKVVSENNGAVKYGFFRKNARSRYYQISNETLVAMNL